MSLEIHFKENSNEAQPCKFVGNREKIKNLFRNIAFPVRKFYLNVRFIHTHSEVGARFMMNPYISGVNSI